MEGRVKIKIEPCPFCGSNARLVSWKKGKCRHVIGCSKSDCILWLPEDVKWNERMFYVSGAWVDKDALIMAWNTRAI